MAELQWPAFGCATRAWETEHRQIEFGHKATQKFEHKRAAMEAGNALIEPRSGDSPQPRVERSGRYAPPWA